jgi:hypothetical protein
MHPILSNRFPWRWSAIVTAFALAVTGCASQAPTGGSAVDRANANFKTTVATGALTGAVIGGVAGGLLGGRNRVAGAAVGAMAGGAIGGAAGSAVAQNNSRQAQTEDTLSGQIAAAQKMTEDAKAAAVDARTEADLALEQSHILQAQFHAGTITAAQYHQKLATSTTQGQAIQTLLGNMQKHESDLRTQIAAAGPNAGPLRESLSDDESSRLSLQSSLVDITSAASAVPQA